MVKRVNKAVLPAIAYAGAGVEESRKIFQELACRRRGGVRLPAAIK